MLIGEADSLSAVSCFLMCGEWVCGDGYALSSGGGVRLNRRMVLIMVMHLVKMCLSMGERARERARVCV